MRFFFHREVLRGRKGRLAEYRDADTRRDAEIAALVMWGTAARYLGPAHPDMTSAIVRAVPATPEAFKDLRARL
jgi:hypothetical protein